MFAGSAERQRHRAELLQLICVSPCVHLSPTLRPSFWLSVRCRLSVSAAPLNVRCAVTLCRCEPFLSLSSALPSGNAALLALQAAAVRMARVGDEGWDWRPSRFDSLSRSSLYVSLFLPSAVKLHWTVEELSHHTHRGW